MASGSTLTSFLNAISRDAIAAEPHTTQCFRFIVNCSNRGALGYSACANRLVNSIQLALNCRGRPKMKLRGMWIKRTGETFKMKLDAATRIAKAIVSAITRFNARLRAPVMRPHAVPVITMARATQLDTIPGQAQSAPRSIDSSAWE